MNFSKLARANKEKHPEAFEAYRSQLIEKEIEKKYSIEQQIGIIRQRDTKPEKFQKFFDDVESCISEVDAELAKGGNA